MTDDSENNDTNQDAALTSPRQGFVVLAVGKGAASGKEEGEFSALLAPRQPDSGCIAGVPRESTAIQSCWT
ncbi:MAG: hypothetical protein KDI24_13140 [Pseudomonadales bacterium]|nr:hypothetical protein [Pseudomonadales bacterium]